MLAILLASDGWGTATAGVRGATGHRRPRFLGTLAREVARALDFCAAYSLNKRCGELPAAVSLNRWACKRLVGSNPTLRRSTRP